VKRLSRLGPESLTHRRLKTDLIMCYKILHILVNIDCDKFSSAPHYVIPKAMS